MTTERRSWLPHVLRLSMFNRGQLTTDPNDVLKLYGVEPEVTQEMPAQRQKISLASFGAGKIQVICAPERIDVIWQVSVQPEMVWLGEFSEAFATLAGPARNVIAAHTWSRLALGVQAGTVVAGHVDGYEAMSEKLPNLKLDGNKCSDFHLQINRFVDIAVGQDLVRLNRLAKWQVGRYVLAPMVPQGGAEMKIGTPFDLYIANAELDINTAIDLKREISGEEAISIFGQAADHAHQMIEQGDA